MDVLIYLIPAALLLGSLGLFGFLWTIRDGQYDDLEGATYRALFEEDDIEQEEKITPSERDKDTHTHKS